MTTTKFDIAGGSYTPVSLEDLTGNEVETIEELSGRAMTDLGTQGTKKGLLPNAYAYVAIKRENPEYNWGDAAGLSWLLCLKFFGATATDAQPADPSGDGDGVSAPLDAPKHA